MRDHALPCNFALLKQITPNLAQKKLFILMISYVYFMNQ